MDSYVPSSAAVHWSTSTWARAVLHVGDSSTTAESCASAVAEYHHAPTHVACVCPDGIGHVLRERALSAAARAGEE